MGNIIEAKFDSVRVITYGASKTMYISKEGMDLNGRPVIHNLAFSEAEQKFLYEQLRKKFGAQDAKV